MAPCRVAKSIRPLLPDGPVTPLYLWHRIRHRPAVHMTRRESFSATHRLGRPEWSAEKNYSVFGKCSNPNWHGHNYELWVTVKAEVDKETGFVVNHSALSRLMHEHVIDPCSNEV